LSRQSAWSDQVRWRLTRSVATVRPGSRWTDASAWRAQPSSQIVVVGSDSRFLTHWEFGRTVDTTTVSPTRAAARGTSRARPERRPVVATVTVPIPTTGGAPTPRLVNGATTTLLTARKAACANRSGVTVTPSPTPSSSESFRVGRYGPRGPWLGGQSVQPDPGRTLVRAEWCLVVAGEIAGVIESSPRRSGAARVGQVLRRGRGTAGRPLVGAAARVRGPRAVRGRRPGTDGRCG
jgi:hypothetical protein